MNEEIATLPILELNETYNVGVKLLTDKNLNNVFEISIFFSSDLLYFYSLKRFLKVDLKGKRWILFLQWAASAVQNFLGSSPRIPEKDFFYYSGSIS